MCDIVVKFDILTTEHGLPEVHSFICFKLGKVKWEEKKRLDLPGITSDCTDTGIDKQASQIAGKYLRGEVNCSALSFHSRLNILP